MQAHPDVGACGSHGEPVFEGGGPPPAWFAGNARAFAVGDQGEPGDAGPGPLWGAGLVVRRAAWRAVREAGFEPRLEGRRGRLATAGEDSELCFVLQHAGWRLWYEPRLRFRHALPASRLTWTYLRAQHHGFGVASVAMDHYDVATRPRQRRRRRLESWTWRVLVAGGYCAWHAARAVIVRGAHRREALLMHVSRGRLRALLGEWGGFHVRARDAARLAQRLEGVRR